MSDRIVESVVLNAGAPTEPRVPLARLAGDLRQRLAVLIARHADPLTGFIDYARLGGSADFAALVALTGHLRGGRPDELATADEQIAFWANLYNALTLHAIIAFGIREGIGDVQDFFRQARYEIGGQPFDLLDIEHGVLRRNQISRNMPTPVWIPGDARVAWIVDRLDPRVHFALVCGARSCPPIRAYEAERLDLQLELATRGFVNADVELDYEAGRIRVSRLFYWYEADFGDVPGWILRYLDPGSAREWLGQHRDDVTLEYRPYDWQLNDRVGTPRA